MSEIKEAKIKNLLLHKKKIALIRSRNVKSKSLRYGLETEILTHVTLVNNKIFFIGKRGLVNTNSIERKELERLYDSILLDSWCKKIISKTNKNKVK